MRAIGAVITHFVGILLWRGAKLVIFDISHLSTYNCHTYYLFLYNVWCVNNKYVSNCIQAVCKALFRKRINYAVKTTHFSNYSKTLGASSVSSP